jgi:hypothetical protein
MRTSDANPKRPQPTLEGQIHRRLSNITGAKAKLILVDEKGGTDGDGSYYIDSRQAVHSLREAFRIK